MSEDQGKEWEGRQEAGAGTGAEIDIETAVPSSAAARREFMLDSIFQTS